MGHAWTLIMSEAEELQDRVSTSNNITVIMIIINTTIPNHIRLYFQKAKNNDEEWSMAPDSDF